MNKCDITSNPIGGLEPAQEVSPSDVQSAFDSLCGTWNGPAIGLLDLDAFFASVEQLDHPQWRGKPVIVGGDPAKRGVVSTCSYEARAYGVHSAMPTAQAQRLCPHAIWTEGHFERYKALSTKVMDILKDETPYIEQVSIDEAFFDISPGRFGSENPVEIARRITARVRELGITCSIGLSTNKTVAKIASEQEKPQGLTIVVPGTEKGFLAPLPVRAMSGIGKRAEESLHKNGIQTLGQLSQASKLSLRSVFGKNAEVMRRRAMGIEQSPVASIADKREVKSVSNERTFAKDLTKKSDVEAALMLLAESVGRRLRKKNLSGHTVTIKIKYTYEKGQTIQQTLRHATNDESEIGTVACELLQSIWQPGTKVRLAGVGVSGFYSEKAYQTSLFDEIEQPQSLDKKSDLIDTLDAVRDKFGTHAVVYGRSTRFSEELSDAAKHEN